MQLLGRETGIGGTERRVQLRVGCEMADRVHRHHHGWHNEGGSRPPGRGGRRASGNEHHTGRPNVRVDGRKRRRRRGTCTGIHTVTRIAHGPLGERPHETDGVAHGMHGEEMPIETCIDEDPCIGKLPSFHAGRKKRMPCDSSKTKGRNEWRCSRQRQNPTFSSKFDGGQYERD